MVLISKFVRTEGVKDENTIWDGKPSKGLKIDSSDLYSKTPNSETWEISLHNKIKEISIFKQKFKMGFAGFDPSVEEF